LPYQNSDYEIISKTDANGVNYRLLLSGEDSAHKNELAFWDGTTPYWSGWSIDKEVWHHIALVRNGAAVTQQ